MFPTFVSPAELDRRCDESRIRKAHPVSAQLEVSSGRLQELERDSYEHDGLPLRPPMGGDVVGLLGAAEGSIVGCVLQICR